MGFIEVFCDINTLIMMPKSIVPKMTHTNISNLFLSLSNTVKIIAVCLLAFISIPEGMKATHVDLNHEDLYALLATVPNQRFVHVAVAQVTCTASKSDL